jgi:hypothetical protein
MASYAAFQGCHHRQPRRRRCRSGPDQSRTDNQHEAGRRRYQYCANRREWRAGSECAGYHCTPISASTERCDRQVAGLPERRQVLS